MQDSSSQSTSTIGNRSTQVMPTAANKPKLTVHLLLWYVCAINRIETPRVLRVSYADVYTYETIQNTYPMPLCQICFTVNLIVSLEADEG